MDKYKKYYGVIGFIAAVVILFFGAYQVLEPRITELNQLKSDIVSKQSTLDNLQQKLNIVQAKIKKIKNSIMSSQKKIYSPIESDLGNETLFFTLYNDVIEMLHANSIKIKSVDYNYNPETDAFVKFGKDVYFVCDINAEIVSNYINLGKLIQDIYQYPYYIKINSLDVVPYTKDKKILISKLSLRLYARTSPMEETLTNTEKKLSGADLPLPQ